MGQHCTPRTHHRPALHPNVHPDSSGLSLLIPSSFFPPGLQIPWVQPPAPGAHFGGDMPSSPTSVQHHRGFQHNRQREKATGGEEQPPKPNLPSPGMRAKLVLWETHTHGELCVPRQPCPTPPMVLTGWGWESSRAAGKFGAARTQPGSGLVPAHQQHPKPPFQPPNQHRVAPLRAEPSPLPLPAPSASGSARRMEGKVLHWEWGTPPSDSLRPHPGPHSAK